MHYSGGVSTIGLMQTTSTLKDLLYLVRNDYKTHDRSSITSLPGKERALLTAFGDLALEEYCYEIVDQVAVAWMDEGFTRATVNRRIALLKRAFHLGRRHGFLRFPMPEFPSYSEDNARTGFLLPEEADQLWQELPLVLADFCMFLYITGMRKGQAASLTWDMVQGDDLIIPAKMCKTREPQILPLTPPLRAIIFRQQKDPKLPFIFHFKNEKINDFRWYWKRAVKRIQKPKLLVHDLRRSAIRNLRLKGVPHEVCKQITGHKTDSVFWRYRIVTNEEVRKALED